MNVYRSATPDQVADGLAWYSVAHAEAVSLDPTNVHRAAGIIAALSPRVRWEHNLVLARAAYENGAASGTLGRSCRAANAILAGAEPADVLNGPKVLAFYQLIADPNHERAVCIDRHATDVAVGMRLDEAERSAWYQLHRGGLYEKFADCYRRAAQRLGVLPGQVQAVTWVTWRDQVGIA
jgi:hypothetical protein